VLATKTHPETEPLGWEQFEKLVSQVNLPVYALGGLSESAWIRHGKPGVRELPLLGHFYKNEFYREHAKYPIL